MTRTARAAAFCLCALALAACASNSRRGINFFPPNSRLVGQQTIDRIKPGETTADWVEAVMGPPTDVEPLQDPLQEIWMYRYQIVGGSSYRLHAKRDSGGTVRTIYLQLASGVVTDKWMD